MAPVPQLQPPPERRSLSPQIGVVVINMLAGPSLFRGAIVAVGEAKRRRPHQESEQSPGPKCVPPRNGHLRRRPGHKLEHRNHSEIHLQSKMYERQSALSHGAKCKQQSEVRA